MRRLSASFGRRKRRKDFHKLRLMVECKNLLLLSFNVIPPFKADSKYVEELLKFMGGLVGLGADKAYLSRKM